ncbi:MAG: type I-E CRISPR-associated protein Cse2/CasB [Flaviflexus sp.]|nr:type I-E CRISPR-associated protein Cse2/CasB [Flaviflexus sp.]
MSTEKKAPAKDWVRLVASILEMRNNEHQYRSDLAALRRGLSPETELYALPYVASFVADSRIKPMTRVAGLMATFPQIAQLSGERKWKSFGAYCYEVSRALTQDAKDSFTPNPRKPDVIASRLRAMPALDLEGLTGHVRSILANAQRTHVEIDFYNLAALFLYWGKGFSTASREHRQKPLRDYYSADHQFNYTK